MKLTDNIYAYVWHGPGNIANSYVIRYLVDGDVRYALVDPGHRFVQVPLSNGRNVVGIGRERSLDTLIASLRSDGIEPDRVKLIVNTHGHPDHCESSAWWRSEYHSSVALHAADMAVYKQSLNGNVYSTEASGTEEPDILLEEGELLLGRPEPLILQILHVPGHSPGSIAIYVPRDKAAIVGDVVFYRSVGRTDFPGGSLMQLKESITRLAKLDIERLLTGHAYGHSGVITGRDDVVLNFKYILTHIV